MRHCFVCLYWSFLDFMSTLLGYCTDWCLIRQSSTERVVCLRSELSLCRERCEWTFYRLLSWKWIYCRDLSIKTSSSIAGTCSSSCHYSSQLSVEISSNVIFWVTRGKYRRNVWWEFATELRSLCFLCVSGESLLFSISVYFSSSPFT